MRSFAAIALFVLLSSVPGRAAVVDGVALPDQVKVGDTPLRLNGAGLRTYSMLRLHIYVAGLYLEHPSDDPDEVMRSPGKKRLDFRFLRDVDAEKGRDAWREGFAANCKPPCHLKPEDVERFLAEVKPVQRGESASLTFDGGRVSIDLNGKPLGTVTDPQFASVILATFIGDAPVTEQLKQQLLGKASP
ncbi:MAG: chalcone isomerase family protein [Acetobacteraceae bacterium]|nr:chalcone isomerase family protein [Acetobacteraceae bacterium]